MSLTAEACISARRRLGWKVKDLAAAAGVGVATIRAIEQGRTPYGATARKIQQAFNDKGLSPVAGASESSATLDSELPVRGGLATDPGVQPPVRQARQKILRSGQALFLSRGYALSINEIARHSGVSRQTIYALFGDREALVREVAKSLVNSTFARMPQFDLSLSPADALLRFCREFMDLSLQPDSVEMLKAFFFGNDQFRDVSVELYYSGANQVIGIIAEYLARLMASGDFRQEDTRRAAERLIGAVGGYSRFRLYLGVGDDVATREIFIAEAVDAFVRAMAPD